MKKILIIMFVLILYPVHLIAQGWVEVGGKCYTFMHYPGAGLGESKYGYQIQAGSTNPLFAKKVNPSWDTQSSAVQYWVYEWNPVNSSWFQVQAGFIGAGAYTKHDSFGEFLAIYGAGQGPNDSWDGRVVFPDGCVSNDPCEDEYNLAVSQCGDESNVITVDAENCVYQCSPCDERLIESQVYSCLSSMGQADVDMNTCVVSCTPNNPECDSQYQLLLANCGPAGIGFWDDSTCWGSCNDECDDAYNALRLRCGSKGVGSFNWTTCEGLCDECKGSQDECAQTCAASGYVNYRVTCDQFDGTRNYDCECLPDTPDPDPEDPPLNQEDPQDTPTPPDPDDPPDPDAADPESDPQDLINQWLKAMKHALEQNDAKKIARLDAIKGDIEKLLGNSALSVNYQKNMDKNLATIAKNQGIQSKKIDDLKAEIAKIGSDITDEIGDMGKGIEDKLDGLGDELSGIGDDTSAIRDQLERTDDDGALASVEDVEYEGLQEGDIPEEGSITDFIQGALQDHPLVDVFNESELELNGATPCFQIPNPYSGSSESVCIDDYESSFNMMGYVLVGLSGFIAFCIIRGK